MGTVKKLTNAYESILLNIVDKYIPSIRKKVYTNEYFLRCFKYVLKDFVSWESLTKSDIYPKNIKYHYKYVNEVFNLWCKYDVFKEAYTELLKKHYFKLTDILKSKKMLLFIDCTFITNKYGAEMITKNPEYKKKKVTKLSTICDENKNILSIVPVNTIYNKKKKCYAFKHELECTQHTLNNISIDIPTYVRSICAGDKAYIHNRQFTLKSKEIQVIAPKRKNQKSKNTKKEKQILSKRNSVENSNANFKNSERVMIRKDKKICTYMEFVYLSLLELFCKQNFLYV